MVLPSKNSIQQDPHSGLPNPDTTCPPPIFGKEGRSPNVGNLDARPLGPLLHDTVFMLPPELSYTLSNDTLALSAKAEATNTKREAMEAVNFIVSLRVG